MTKLLQRLSDAARSGVYKVPDARAVLEASGGSTLRVARIDLSGATGKEQLLKGIAAALEFPAWFGGNWDALEDCLADLSWARADGHVLLFEGAGALSADDAGILADVLASVASQWAGRGTPFFALFVDTRLPLPDLYRAGS